MIAARRLVSKVVTRGALAAGTCLGASVGVDRYENYYWQKHDPFRTRRSRGGEGTISPENSSAGRNSWREDPQTGETLLQPTKPAESQTGWSSQNKQRVVVLGTGWGARYFLEGIDRDQYDVRVVSPRNFFLFTPLLPSTSAGTLSPAAICSPIRELVSYKNDRIWWRVWYMLRGRLPCEVRYYPAEADDVDFERKIVHCSSNEGSAKSAERFGIHYDKLVICVGADVNTFNTPGVKENCIFMKEISDGTAARKAIFDNFEKTTLPSGKPEEEMLAERKRLLNFVVVGGGPTGVEVAAELNDLINEDLVGSGHENSYGHTLYKSGLRGQAKVTLIQSGNCLLNAYHPKVSKLAYDVMTGDGVDVRLSHRVKSVESDHIVVMNKETKETTQIPYGVCIWATGVGAMPLTRKLAASLGAAQSNIRALRVDPHLRVHGQVGPAPDAKEGNKLQPVVDGVYALGDCCTVSQPKLMNDIDRLWKLADTSGDDRVSQQELHTFLEKLRVDYPQANLFVSQSQRMVKQFDTNNDGFLSRAEFGKMIEYFDTHHRSMPPTAQVAKGQGKWLANALNSESSQKRVLPFDFKSQGQMAYVGKNVSIMGLGADGSIVMGDSHITNLAWRGAYWSMLADARTAFMVPFDWAFAWLLGRDSSRW